MPWAVRGAVLLLDAGFQTSRALAAVNAELSVMVFCPAISVAVVLPLVCAVPFSASRAQERQNPFTTGDIVIVPAHSILKSQKPVVSQFIFRVEGAVEDVLLAARLSIIGSVRTGAQGVDPVNGFLRGVWCTGGRLKKGIDLSSLARSRTKYSGRRNDARCVILQGV